MKALTTMSLINKQQQDNNNLKSTQFVYCVADSGGGKSFTGDYLSVMHNFTHIDGDGPMKNCHIPKHKETTWKLLKWFEMYVKKGEDGPEDLWQPYFLEISNQALDAAKQSGNNKVILTHATPRQTMREFVVQKWIDAGVLPENITVLQLTVDPEVKLKGLYYRTKFQCKQGGMTLEDVMKPYGWDGEGELTYSDFVELNKKMNPDLAKNKDGCFTNVPEWYKFLKTVDVSGRDMSHLDGVDKVLDLVGKRKNKSWTFEEICDKVKLLDAKRDETLGANLPVVIKMMADAKNLADGNNIDDDINKT